MLLFLNVSADVNNGRPSNAEDMSDKVVKMLDREFSEYESKINKLKREWIIFGILVVSGIAYYIKSKTKNIFMYKIIKVSLAILFFICLADMPYGYFQLVRFAALIGFAILAFQALQSGNQTEMITFMVLAILFQPIFKISLGRTIWNVVDVVVGIWLLLSMVPKRNS